MLICIPEVRSYEPTLIMNIPWAREENIRPLRLPIGYSVMGAYI